MAAIPRLQNTNVDCWFLQFYNLKQNTVKHKLVKYCGILHTEN